MFLRCMNYALMATSAARGALRDVTQLERCITPRTRGICLIHTYGHPVEMDPLHAAEEFGFRSLVEKSVDAAKAKQEARDAKAKEREEAKAKREKAKADAKAARERKAEEKKAHAKAVEEAAEARKSQPGAAKAKVGRNVVDGEILADGLFKYKKGDEEVETSNYTPVIDPDSVPVPTVDAN